MMNFGEVDDILPIPISPALTFQEPDLSDLLGLYREIELQTDLRYTSKPLLVGFYGSRNIDLWADLDNDKDAGKIRTRIIQMMIKADSIINSRLRDGPYPIPFITPFPRTIENLSTRLAGALLFEHRGVTDSSEQKHELNWHIDYVDKVIRWILSRKWRLEYGLTAVRTHVPSANGVLSNSGILLDEDTQPSPYCVREDVENVYGKTNVIKWADLDGDRESSLIGARISTMIGLADNEINCRLRAGAYKIPFTLVPYERVLVDLSARLAGVVLYECRGPTNADSDRNKVQWHRKRVEETIDGLMSRRYRFDRAKATQRITTPVISA